MRAHGQPDGGLYITSRLAIPAQEIELRVTTSGGPGGQHANRALTRVVATFRIGSSAALSEADRARLTEKFGSAVRSGASRYRSQGQNRAAALDQLSERLAQALERPTTRRATKPTRASKVRRVDEKKARGRVKDQRRRPEDD